VETTQLLKGVLDLAVLAVVAESDAYGYDVVRRLRDAGIGEVGDASVYGTLRRLYAGGALTSYVEPSVEGPHRKYYGLTARGRDQLQDDAAGWRAFSDAMDRLVGSAVSSPAAATVAPPRAPSVAPVAPPGAQQPASERMRVVGATKRAATKAEAGR
jgi:PadR family transcriptional regulator PadR